MTLKDPSSHPEASYKDVVWCHTGNNKTYKIIEFALLEHSLFPMVVYQSTEGGPVWVRPATEFFDGRFVGV